MVMGIYTFYGAAARQDPFRAEVLRSDEAAGGAALRALIECPSWETVTVREGDRLVSLATIRPIRFGSAEPGRQG